MPARTDSPPPPRSVMETLAQKYDVTRNGFLPHSAPVKRLSMHYATWELLAQCLPELLKERCLRGVVDGMKVLSVDNLTSEEEWQRAYVILTFLAHGYIWGGEKPSEVCKSLKSDASRVYVNLMQVLPPQIAVPLLQVSEHFDLPPTATYAGLVLWNFQSTSTDFSDPDSLKAITTFTGTEDESWFYMVSVALEAQTAYVIPIMVQAIEAIERRDYETMSVGLEEMINCIKEMDALLTRMYEKCEPATFYHDIRPLLAGSMNMEKAGLPNGVFYDEGDGKGSWRKLMGGSNGQSSTIQFLDIVLGVVHTGGAENATCPVSGVRGYASTTGCPISASKERRVGYHEQVRAYMPQGHRNFLKNLSRMGSLQEFAMSDHPGAEHARLRGLHEEACRTMGDFRKKHIQIVTRYIIIPKTKQPTDKKVRNLATASSESSDTSELKGTGGTSLAKFLAQSRDETYMAGCLTREESRVDPKGKE
ncbi:hypothetical protein JX265_006508 [Neoarthrinium moseri]|uniref:Indoleamine 2,3-dioxygenase n=1 Tax=Neoarthrinium moseri TaxID=1658444 RepID=A0A9P9WLM1_9PEZI|nr:hypothetical protein JX265_006508 [Neoarthrinium moseri]